MALSWAPPHRGQIGWAPSLLNQGKQCRQAIHVYSVIAIVLPEFQSRSPRGGVPVSRRYASDALSFWGVKLRRIRKEGPTSPHQILHFAQNDMQQIFVGKGLVSGKKYIKLEGAYIPLTP